MRDTTAGARQHSLPRAEHLSNSRKQKVWARNPEPLARAKVYMPHAAYCAAEVSKIHCSNRYLPDERCGFWRGIIREQYALTANTLARPEPQERAAVLAAIKAKPPVSALRAASLDRHCARRRSDSAVGTGE